MFVMICWYVAVAGVGHEAARGEGLPVSEGGGAALGGGAGWTADPAHDAECPGRLQGRGVSRRGHHPVVHRRHLWLQRGYPCE